MVSNWVVVVGDAGEVEHSVEESIVNALANALGYSSKPESARSFQGAHGKSGERDGNGTPQIGERLQILGTSA